MARILVIRLSALGDVAISVPLLKALAEQYPEHQFTMLSQPFVASLFEEFPSNFFFRAAEIKGKHKRFIGLFRLFLEIGWKNVDFICDLHDTMRSRFLCSLFRFYHVPFFRINKERSERSKLTRRDDKIFKPLKTSFERYKDVFAAAGIPLKFFDEHPEMKPSPENLKEIEAGFGQKTNRWIGIAPFARHEGKIYPLDKMEKVVAHFAKDKSFTVYLFGGGKGELAKMEAWKEKYPSLQIHHRIGLSNEVKLMNCLDIMLAMDSANMHLASLAHTPVVSVWGATHPYAGFYGLFQKETNAIQSDLSCRPCSVFGNEPCFRFDYACMNSIKPEQIIRKLEKELGI